MWNLTYSLCPLQCVVIGLQSTGEARTLEQLEECGGELNDFVSTAKYVLLLPQHMYVLVLGLHISAFLMAVEKRNMLLLGHWWNLGAWVVDFIWDVALYVPTAHTAS